MNAVSTKWLLKVDEETYDDEYQKHWHNQVDVEIGDKAATTHFGVDMTTTELVKLYVKYKAGVFCEKGTVGKHVFDG